MSDEVERTVDALEAIENDWREFDTVSVDRYEQMQERAEQVAERFFTDEKTDATLRGFLAPLDLHFDPEEFIETDGDLDVTPEIIGATVYLDMRPKMADAYLMETFMSDYVNPHSSMTQDEFFMVEEYIREYYE